MSIFVRPLQIRILARFWSARSSSSSGPRSVRVRIRLQNGSKFRYVFPKSGALKKIWSIEGKIVTESQFSNSPSVHLFSIWAPFLCGTTIFKCAPEATIWPENSFQSYSEYSNMRCPNGLWKLKILRNFEKMAF